MDNQKLIAQFRKLTRSTKWELTDKIDLQFNNYHAQGIVRIGKHFYLSSVELIEVPVKYDEPSHGHDRTPGMGVGHLFVFDDQGELVHDTPLGEGNIYHPGGIDYDGNHIWVPVAEYRPNSQSIVYKVDPRTMKAEESFRVHDHIGGLVREGYNGKLIGNSWGSRKFYEWNPNGQLQLVKENSSHFIDYQDGHYVGEGKMIVSGISELSNPAGCNSQPYELGGLALIDMKTLDMIHEVPITEFSPQGHVITRNPVYLESAGQKLRLYAVPDDNDGSLLVYEASICE
ncbi:DUF6454 family protein [Paenibacillus aceris]|uniref:Uncharacterized protein n=1 Tax=Paenibacillus aceris TaxID=869555 RepID=A0ABS4I0R2_9BACL|nr:DUF6454 family protein [Paenibacillus aceris]MBP1964151.1 hypothetical protein [Paenibacillus aceris]